MVDNICDPVRNNVVLDVGDDLEVVNIEGNFNNLNGDRFVVEVIDVHLVKVLEKVAVFVNGI